MTRSLAAALALALVTSAAQASPADVAAAKPTIDHANADWLPAMQRKDADALAADYAPNGLFVLPDGRTLVGKAAVADFYRSRLANAPKVVGGGIHQDGLAEAAGGLIVEWGHGGATTVDATGKTSTSEGPYMTVWKKGPDGRWAIIRNLVF